MIAFKMEEIWTAAASSNGKGAARFERPETAYLTLAETQALLGTPAAAEMRAREVLKTHSADPVARFLLGAARARQGQDEEARAILDPLVQSQPQMGPAWRELGFVLEKLGARDQTAAALMKALDFNYMDESVLFALGDLVPWGDASDFAAPRFRRATALFAQRKFGAALAGFGELLRAKPEFALVRALKAIALAGEGQTDAAIAEFGTFIEECDWPGLWLEYARALRSKRDPRAAAALKRAMRILPSFVDAYMLYASIKPFRWDEAMIGAARAQLARPDLAPEDRAQFHSALGKAYEDLENYAESFENYRKCNEILRHGGNRSAEMSKNFVRRTMTIYNPALLRGRSGTGCPARGPVFIVGMKRSGSTLVEQILSRHSAVEALGELEDLTEIIGRRRGYPQVLKELGPESFRAMGEEYMALARQRRKLGKPFFTDKLPHNFGRTGLIHLILPNAKIIDVRRHPLDCGISCYKHYFPGARLSLSLTDFASGYVDYVRLMAHFDEVLPGKVHRVIYRRMVGNLEFEVRRLLDYLGLPFEEECLRFDEETRHVKGPSADQVRMPLYDTGIDYWRNFEAWLGPMKAKLGYVLDVYPDVPKFYDEIRFRPRKPLGLGQTGGQVAHFRGLRQRHFENA
ncbi:MAG TPA: sulfotransferase [Rhizomicrobium sp.]|nr:sulfotransferase [Rhizomicrobium sp.]